MEPAIEPQEGARLPDVADSCACTPRSTRSRAEDLDTVAASAEVEFHRAGKTIFDAGRRARRPRPRSCAAAPSS